MSAHQRKTLAFCRDYKSGDRFPIIGASQCGGFTPNYWDASYKKCDETRYECWQPECIQNDEFNIVIMIEGIPFKARGIHFDFEEGE